MMSNAMKNMRKKTEFQMKREYTANTRTLLSHRGVPLNADVISCINEAAYPYSVSRSGSAGGQGPSSWKIIPKEDGMIVRVCVVFHSFDVIQTLFVFAQCVCHRSQAESVWFRWSMFSGIAQQMNEEMDRSNQLMIDESPLRFREEEENRQIVTEDVVEDLVDAVVDIA